MSLRVALATAPSSCSNSFFIIHLGHFLNLLQHTNSADEVIFLPLAARSRYQCAWKMAYFSTEPPSERCNLTGKNRVRDSFRLSNETHPAKRRQPLQPRRKIGPTATKTASGIPYWPCRDPIGERGGKNLYGFVGNDGMDTWDFLGLQMEKLTPAQISSLENNWRIHMQQNGVPKAEIERKIAQAKEDGQAPNLTKDPTPEELERLRKEPLPVIIFPDPFDPQIPGDPQSAPDPFDDEDIAVFRKVFAPWLYQSLCDCFDAVNEEAFRRFSLLPLVEDLQKRTKRRREIHKERDQRGWDCVNYFGGGFHRGGGGATSIDEAKEYWTESPDEAVNPK